jgi:RraA family protein
MFRTAAIHSSIRPVNRVPLCGTAFTVRVPEGDNLMMHKALDLVQPGDVLMIDAGGGETRAIFGELMATYARLRGVAGIVVDGCVRDYDGLSQMEDMAIYAKGATPNGPYKNGPGEIGTVIQVGGRIVKPGDIVLGDADGVITIDPADAPAILEAVRGVEQKEAAIMETMLRDGTYIRPWVDEMLKALGCEGLGEA